MEASWWPRSDPCWFCGASRIEITCRTPVTRWHSKSNKYMLTLVDTCFLQANHFNHARASHARRCCACNCNYMRCYRIMHRFRDKSNCWMPLTMLEQKLSAQGRIRYRRKKHASLIGLGFRKSQKSVANLAMNQGVCILSPRPVCSCASSFNAGDPLPQRSHSQLPHFLEKCDMMGYDAICTSRV